MSQTQAVEEALREYQHDFAVGNGDFSCAEWDGMNESAFKAGAAWAATSPAECAVLEAAQALVDFPITEFEFDKRTSDLRDAVAALEREKVEGASNGN